MCDRQVLFLLLVGLLVVGLLLVVLPCGELPEVGVTNVRLNSVRGAIGAGSKCVVGRCCFVHAGGWYPPFEVVPSEAEIMKGCGCCRQRICGRQALSCTCCLWGGIPLRLS